MLENRLNLVEYSHIAGFIPPPGGSEVTFELPKAGSKLNLHLTVTAGKGHQNEDLRLKSIQVFFVKPSSFQDLKDTIHAIVYYWQKCVSPNYINLYVD